VEVIFLGIQDKKLHPWAGELALLLTWQEHEVEKRFSASPLKYPLPPCRA
jgi:hypothetical protein